MKTTTVLAVIFGGLLPLSASEQSTDCRTVSQSLQKAVVGKEVKDMLKLLEKEVSATPQCSCELVRSAIIGYKAKPIVVGSIVDTAITAAPDHMEVIVTCALATAPDAEAEILTIANKVGFVPNPLNFPGMAGQSPAGGAGGAGGQFSLGQNSPTFVNPPTVTSVDPD